MKRDSQHIATNVQKEIWEQVGQIRFQKPS